MNEGSAQYALSFQTEHMLPAKGCRIVVPPSHSDGIQPVCTPEEDQRREAGPHSKGA